MKKARILVPLILTLVILGVSWAAAASGRKAPFPKAGRRSRRCQKHWRGKPARSRSCRST